MYSAVKDEKRIASKQRKKEAIKKAKENRKQTKNRRYGISA
jgi:hypothetical protein